MTRRLATLVLPVFVAAALLLLLISTLGAPSSVSAAVPRPSEVWVCPTGACGAPEVWQNSTSLSAAMMTVAQGGTIHVAAGTYVGGATLFQDVTIDGEGPDFTVIQGASRVFTITSAR